MYIIYNDTIWSSYSDFRARPYLNAACKKRKKCSRTLRHLNHVHISLGYAGAAAQTSWYRSRGVAAEPVLHPGTEDLDATETAVIGLTVPVNGAVVSSSFYLRPGVTYRIVATGSAGYDPTSTGDANCALTTEGTTAPTARGTLVTPILGLASRSTEGSQHPVSAFAAATPDTHGLLVNGALRWEGGCQPDHTYETWYRPDTRQRLQLQYADAVPGDNTGAVTVFVARDDITRASLVGCRRGRPRVRPTAPGGPTPP
jgi:hypothetical protein